MSLDDIDKIPRCADDIRVMLLPIQMPYETAQRIEGELSAIEKLAASEKEHNRRTEEYLRNIIEGLMANWPHTEIVDHYKPTSQHPVFTRDAALKRAGHYLHRPHDLFID